MWLGFHSLPAASSSPLALAFSRLFTRPSSSPRRSPNSRRSTSLFDNPRVLVDEECFRHPWRQNRKSPRLTTPVCTRLRTRLQKDTLCSRLCLG